jgi:hypothetical protein
MLNVRPMRRLLLVVLGLAVVLLVMPASALVAQESGPAYYISPRGDDANPGTSPRQPWRTLARASVETYHPGDRILLQGGQSFPGTLDLRGEGSPDAPIVVSSYGKGRATINAGQSDGIVVRNAGGYSINTLNVRGAGSAVNGGSGIRCVDDVAGDV